jgi:hypothetical protein
VTDIQSWREDLAHLTQQLRTRHANLFHTIKPVHFKKATTALYEAIPYLMPHQIAVEMSRIVAMIGDGHTSFRLNANPSLGFHPYPVRFYEFSDGIFVCETDEAHRHLLGKLCVRLSRLFPATTL